MDCHSCAFFMTSESSVTQDQQAFDWKAGMMCYGYIIDSDHLERFSEAIVLCLVSVM